jgi:hypothetical protein
MKQEELKKEIVRILTEAKGDSFNQLIEGAYEIFTADELLSLFKKEQEALIERFYRRIDNNTLISEMYGWRSILDQAKEDTLDELNESRSE